jgi:hypothetical protein
LTSPAKIARRKVRFTKHRNIAMLSFGEERIAEGSGIKKMKDLEDKIVI